MRKMSLLDVKPCICLFVALLLCLPSSTTCWVTNPATATTSTAPTASTTTAQEHCYDVVIIGAGAGGLFASGAAQLFGKRTALIDMGQYLGGDCTNATCVPSKALRAASRQRTSGTLEQARAYVSETVDLVRKREDPDKIPKTNNNVDVLVVDSCRFVSPTKVQVRLRNRTDDTTDHVYEDTELRIKGDKFILATGASPVVPEHLEQQAKRAGIPFLTYRTLLASEGSAQTLWNMDVRKLVIVGGGATACELGQSLARLSGNQTLVYLVAPEILPQEDVRLRDAACRILESEAIIYHRARLQDIRDDKALELDNGNVIENVDAVLLCIGRSPTPNLAMLDLDQAQVAWTKAGVTVCGRSLRSTTNDRVYAVGDCSDAVPLRFRTATQAAWTAFHAVRNALLPKLVCWGSPSVHPCVPRVIYTVPELACVGLTQAECVEKYGVNGFQSMYVPELGTDRADMERANRDTSVTFVELRAERGTGRLLGASFCSPAAAELANNVGMAITNGMTTATMARSIFSYPSYGYLMHRVALAMVLSETSGVLQTLGPLPGLFAKLFGQIKNRMRIIRSWIQKLFGGKAGARKRRWEVEGVRQAVPLPLAVGLGAHRRLVSFMDLQANATLREMATKLSNHTHLQNYQDWSRRQVDTPTA